MSAPRAGTGPSLLQGARALLVRTMTFYRDDPRTSSWLRGRLERLDQPLRIAVTGRVKSGKSTLINALIGHELAPTDTGERTQVNTFYQYGPEPKITVHTPHGTAQNVPVTTVDVNTVRDLQNWRPDEVARLDIEVPAPGLQAISFIETPGVSSSEVTDTGRSALAQILSEADGVLYLTRYPHQADLQFLQSVHELQIARYTPINTIVALSRADEMGSGSSEALVAAERVAQNYREDAKMRSFTQHVLPVSGLVAQAGALLAQDEFQALGALARMPQQDLEALLLSSDRFANSAQPENVPPEHRQQLQERLGHFGVERSISLIREGADTPQKLSSALLDESRMNQLQEAVHRQFVERQDALRARSVLLAVDMVLRANPRNGVQQLRGEFERFLANAHEWEEMRLLSSLHSEQVRFPPEMRVEAQRLLGAFGTEPYRRLGQDPQATGAILANEAGEVLARWRNQAVSPMYDRQHRDAIRVVLRSCERLIARQLHG